MTKHFTYNKLNGGNLAKLNEMADAIDGIVENGGGEGAIGLPGPKGDQGEKGEKGEKGTAGTNGKDGENGSDGQSIDQADWDNLVDRVAALEAEVNVPSGPE